MRTAKIAAVMGVSLSLAACAQMPVSPGSEPAPQVRLDSGVIEGGRTDGIDRFLGIPFAAPPVGALRWRAPQPVASWTDVKQTVAYGHDCMQMPFPSDAAPLGTPPAEDCLYANVWRPSNAAGKLPVVVWIYGGGFVNGGASPPTYAGANLAKQGVLFFSFNYRVGRFGTFAHPLLTKENADHGLTGNYGYLDQIAALNWVRRNIAAFGGDPDNVTIIGESAGGMSVHNLMTSPLAKGLFAKAVSMSGGNGKALGAGNLAATEAIGTAFAKSKGIAETDPDALTKLRALSADAVTDGLSMIKLFGAGPRTFASPFVDGTIAVDAGEAYASGNFNTVPLMIGATSGDMGGKTGFMIGGARHAAATIAAQGVPVWEYRFSYVAESQAEASAGHASDIPFFFNNQAIKYADKTTAKDNAMGKTISTYLANFAKSGNPNGAGLPQWDGYSKQTDILMDFAKTGEAVLQKDPWGAEIDAATH